MTRAEKIVEESESQEQWEMANLRPRRTGLPMTIWVQEPSDDSRTQHGPRIKAGRQHGDRFDPTDSVTVTVEEIPKKSSLVSEITINAWCGNSSGRTASPYWICGTTVSISASFWSG